MLRALVLLLLLANALFFAWWQGWLAPVLPPRADAREPERLAHQVRPEWITVLTATAASAAAAQAAAAGASAPAPAEPEVLLCLETGPFNDSTAAAAERVLEQHSVPEGSVAREPAWAQHTWGVVVARLADRDALRAKAEELRRLGVPSVELATPPALVPGLRLGNYSDRYGAETALANLNKKGVRTARVVPLPVGAPLWWLRVQRADGEMQTQLKSLPTERLRGGFKPCASTAAPAPAPR